MRAWVIVSSRGSELLSPTGEQMSEDEVPLLAGESAMPGKGR